MQKWKNILGSRKKGAQEPHAAREPRYDYQGNTTSNLKGISLERLTLPVGITSYSLCPLFNPSSIADSCLMALNMCVCALFLFVSPRREFTPCTGWVPESGRRRHRYGLTRQLHAAADHRRSGRLTVNIWSWEIAFKSQFLLLLKSRFFCVKLLNKKRS